ncbi:MAG TPA: hypothetical protein VGP71_01495 [Burkholderiales bacterium]|jgi:hypothetical protein|nr:hypothetical protein [Burkholderiales bacterium]
MFRRFLLPVIALFLGALATGSAQAQEIQLAEPARETQSQARERDGRQIAQGPRRAERGRTTQPQERDGGAPQRGKVKEVDVERRTITLIVDEKELVLAVTDRTEIRGARGDTLVERLRSFEPGNDVMFIAVDRHGSKVLVGMMKAGGDAGNRSSQPLSPDHAALKPLDELGTSEFQGSVGGLYPQGQNARPKRHEDGGLRLAAQVQPRDTDGAPDPAGKIVLLSIGISNASQASQGFESLLAAYRGKNPRLLFVNGAGGMTQEALRNPDDRDSGARYWADVDRRLRQAGATRAQVQAIWIKVALVAPDEGFPEYAKRLQSVLTRVVQILAQRFPNAKLAYLSSRTYGGFAKTPLNPEPYAYESGFSVKWLIEEQLRGNPDLNYDAAKGTVKSPWLSWGPYLWANGENKRAADGLSWEAADFSDDGTHLSAAGQRKVGQLLLDFFKSDSTTAGWFNAR